MKKIYLISFCLSLTVFCATFIQSCKKNDDIAVEDKPQGKLLDNARAWFKEQSLLSPSPDSNDIQLSSFKPDWNKFKVIKNAGGTDVIGIPLSTNDGSYMEINYFNIKERNFGIIKKYNWLNGEMMIYSGTGRLQQRGLFDPTTNKISVLEKINGTNTMKLAFEDMYYLPGVTINGGSTYTPPPPPPSYTFPPAPIYTPPYDPNTNPNNIYYGGGSGNGPGGGTTTATDYNYSGDGFNDFDDNTSDSGPKTYFPTSIQLNNGKKVTVTFGTTSSDNKSAYQQVSVKLIQAVVNALNLSSAQITITDIYIKATTNGAHAPTSNHYLGLAVDISRINGQYVQNLGGSNPLVQQLQIALDNVPNSRENFGPAFQHKLGTDHYVGGHTDHIHFSVNGD